MADHETTLRDLDHSAKRRARLAAAAADAERDQRDLILRAARERLAVTAIARAAGVHRATVHRILRAAGLAHLADR